MLRYFEIMLGKVLVVWARLPMCNSHFFFFHSLTFVEISGVLILIEGNDLSA